MSNLGTINIGDRLYNYSTGKYIIVKHKTDDVFVVYDEENKNKISTAYCYTYFINSDGYSYHKQFKSANQVIFWDKPQIIAPSKPKVKREYKVHLAQRWGVFDKDSKHLQINMETNAWLIFASQPAAEKYIANLKYKDEFYIDEVNITYMTEG